MLRARISSALRTRPMAYARIVRLRERVGLAPHEPEQDLIPFLCDPKKIAIDVGANVGSVTDILLRSASGVIAIEPIPELFDLLQARFRKEVRASKLAIEHCALSSEDGDIDLYIPQVTTGLASVERKGTLDAGRIIRIRARTLDYLTQAKIGFVKIDVEGHENAVVKGGMAVLMREKPVLMIESEERHHPGSLRLLTETLSPAGYDAYFLFEKTLHPVATFDPERHQNVAMLNARGTARIRNRIYINNFLFFPSGSTVFERVEAYLAR